MTLREFSNNYIFPFLLLVTIIGVAGMAFVGCVDAMVGSPSVFKSHKVTEVVACTQDVCRAVIDGSKQVEITAPALVGDCVLIEDKHLALPYIVGPTRVFKSNCESK